jgi:hypothetical protein
LKQPIIVKNSPIEFVLTGPFAGADQVLVKSENAALDLVGAASFKKYERKKSSIWWLKIFYPEMRKVNVTNGHAFEDVVSTADNRLSDYFFAWSGQTTNRTQDTVDQLISVRLHDIVTGVRQNNQARLEWSLSAPVRVISEEIESNKNRRRTLRIIAIMYVVLGALLITANLTFKFLR